jgi:hypothetical protein
VKKTAKSSEMIRANKRKAQTEGEASAPAGAGDWLSLCPSLTTSVVTHANSHRAGSAVKSCQFTARFSRAATEGILALGHDPLNNLSYQSLAWALLFVANFIHGDAGIAARFPFGAVRPFGLRAGAAKA